MSAKRLLPNGLSPKRLATDTVTHILTHALNLVGIRGTTHFLRPSFPLSTPSVQFGRSQAHVSWLNCEVNNVPGDGK